MILLIDIADDILCITQDRLEELKSLYGNTDFGKECEKELQRVHEEIDRRNEEDKEVLRHES